MARNGSGTYAKVNTFTAGNTITSSGHNQNWDDLVTEMTNSVAADGQTTMTGALKGFAGTAAAPGYTFAVDTDTGFYRIGANSIGVSVNGTLLATFNTTGLTIASGSLSIPAGGLSGAGLTDATVTLPKLATQANLTVVGNISGGSASPVALTLSGFNTSGTTVAAPFPPTGVHKNLVVKVASNTTATIAADYVVVTDGTNFQTVAVSSTINFATTGANGLDAGSVATSTWYAGWVVAKADGTVACIASTSATAPTMPSGYTFKARVTWFRTASGVAQLIGIWQLGRRAQYVVGLAQCSALPQLDNGTKGSVSIPTWSAASVSSVIPSTASEAILQLQSIAGAIGAAMLAPNNSYGAINSTTNPPPVHFTSSSSNDGLLANLLLESTNVYWASNNNWALWAFGWVDNI